MSTYRDIDLSEWTKVGEGGNGTTYENPAQPDLILKVDRKQINTLEFVKHEFETSKAVEGLGLPTPRMIEMVRVGDLYATISDKIKNKRSLSRICHDEPERIEEMARFMCENGKILFNTPCDTSFFPSRKEQLMRALDKVQFISRKNRQILKSFAQTIYEQRNYFLTSRQYDSYPRDRKTKVYLGEYAAKDKKLIDALAEGLYLLHVERNADVVVMTSYAPLFARKNTNNWNPDLIYFDNERPFLTCSYYVQQMFGQSSGDYFYGDCVKFDREDDNLLGQSVVLDTQSRKLYLKVCNAGENAAKATIDLSRFKGMKANVQKSVIKGQPNDENGFDAQPIAPVKEAVKLKAKQTLDVEPYSIALYTISL